VRVGERVRGLLFYYDSLLEDRGAIKGRVLRFPSENEAKNERISKMKALIRHPFQHPYL